MEEITLKLSDDEIEAIRTRATALAQSEIVSDRWGQEEELSATEEKIKNNTGASVAYLLKYQIRDDSPDVDEWGNPV